MKPWGSEQIVWQKDTTQFKLLNLKKGEMTSLQYHKKKQEVVMCIKGKCIVTISDLTIEKPLTKGKSLIINAKTIHRYKAINNVTLAEICIGSDTDIVRLEDKYGRNKEKR